MAKIDITRTELVWPGKYNEDGTLREVPRVNLPFQVIETVNESRATREAKRSDVQTSLFDFYEGKEGDSFEEGWKNKLIWGDNLLVMGSLLEKFAGKIDLIYIDPPFATGADFSFTTQIGESDEIIPKKQSIIEEKAYRDTWGKGTDSFISMIYERLVLMRDLLAEDGSIYVHCDWRVNSYIRLVLDEIFGNHVNEIAWEKIKSVKAQTAGYGNVKDSIFFYAKDKLRFNQQRTAHDEDYLRSMYRHIDEDGRRYRLHDFTQKGQGEPKDFGEPWGMIAPPPGKHWIWSQEKITAGMKKGDIVFSKNDIPSVKRYLDEVKGQAVSDIWADINPIGSISKERNNYPTQKPEALLNRIIKASSNEDSLIADFFCGSGTTLAVAEKLGRRWIGCDLGRWGIHVTRKRMLGIENCKQFEILNLGKYERQYWQGVTFGGAINRRPTEQALYEYLAFILKLYGAQPLSGLGHLHGKKGRAMIHIGAVDAPVTIDEIEHGLNECVQLQQGELHVLGWEWEMGVAGANSVRKGGLMQDQARTRGVKLVLLQIPREVMEQQAVDKDDVRFFELAYLKAVVGSPRKLTASIELQDFVIPNSELIPDEVRDKVAKWSNYIDYWAVDWDFQNDTFIQGWVAYRTRKDRTLPLVSDSHTYDKPGKYRALVKVIDIFGNDTSQALDVEVK